MRRYRQSWWILVVAMWIAFGALHLPHQFAVVIVLVMLFGSGVFRVRGGRVGRCNRSQVHGRSHGGYVGGPSPDYDYVEPVWQPQHQDPPRPVVDLTKPASTVAPSLAELAADPRLPQDLREQALRLDERCGEALTYLGERNADAAEVFEIDQIRGDFGPEALKSFLALAPGTADTTVLADGKTGHQLVTDELDLLLRAVSERMTHAGRLGSEPLLANHRFLQEKFGRRQGDDLQL